MADEKIAKVKSERAKQFGKKKTNRFSKEECKKELARLAEMKDTSSEYFKDITARFESLK